MQRFAIKIDKSVKARLKNCCRLCGIGNPNQVDILNAAEWIDLTIDDEVPLQKKIAECVGIEVLKNDKMPQQICALCVDKINDFYEFREMCQATNIQTRKLLNLPDITKIKAPKKTVTIKTDEDAVESILGISDTETKMKTEPPPKSGKKSKKSTASTSSTATTSNENRFRGMTKREIEITLELERIKKEEEDEQTAKFSEILPTTMTTSTGRTKNGKKKKSNAKGTLDAPLLAPKAPNQRERKREMEQKRIEKKRKLDTKVVKAPVPKKIKREPGISCLVCDERFEKISFRDTHLQAMHRPTISDYGCATCHEQFLTLDENTLHNEWHWKNNVPHKCIICNGKFPKLVNFQSHLLACVHPSFVSTAACADNILCGNCNLEYETQNLYDWHACFIGDNSRCPQCQRIFIKRTVLLKHMFKCTGLPQGTAAATVAPSKKVKGKTAKKKTAKGVQKAKNKPDITPQNSFKFEPETIIEQNVDGDDAVFDTVDNSFMDTHFADSDTEFEPSNSIITSTGLDMPNSPAKEMEHDNSTINPDECQIPALINPNANANANANASASVSAADGLRTNTNIDLSLLQCRVKLEPLDVASLPPSTISPNVVHPEPVVEPPQRPLTVPPLTIRIKKEVIRPGYGDEFDVNLARNIKQERVDETYELAGGSTSDNQHYGNAHKKSKHRDKLKKLYKKPALLAIKIKQERMERETNDDGEYSESYPDYSMSSDDYSMPSDAAAVNSTFDNNPLPIITQIHSVIEPGIPVATDSSINLPIAQISSKPPISSQPTPFIPIRIKSEFQRPLSPPPPLPLPSPAEAIDSTSISQNPDDERQHDSENPLTSYGRKSPETEQQHPETEQKSSSEQQPDNAQQQSDETVDSTMVIENSNNDIGNECMQSKCSEHDEKDFENNEIDEHSTQMECDTSSSLNDNVQMAANMQTDETVDSTAENDDELESNQTNAIYENSSPQICTSAVQKDECSLQLETIPETQNQNAFNETQSCQESVENIQRINENVIACSAVEVIPNIETTSTNAVDGDGDIDMGEGQQLSENLACLEEHDAATSTEMLQPINEMCDVSDALAATDVTNENSNISPIDFIENANDESLNLNFIDQLVHEVADTMVAPSACEDDEIAKAMIQNNTVPIESTDMSFIASEFNYNLGCSIKNAENNESITQTIDGVDKSTVNDTLMALSDIPDIDCDLLPVLNANECTSNGNEFNECPPPVCSMEDSESGATAADGCDDNDGNNDTDTDAMRNTDADIQNQHLNLPLN